MMFKKMMVAALALAVVCGGTTVFAEPGNDLRIIPIIVNGHKVKFPDTEPYIDTNGRTMVPVRFVSEKLGGEVTWDDATRVVGIHYEGKTIRLPVGSRQVSIDGTDIELDTAAELYEGRTMVPLRFVSEAMGSKVEWDDGAHAVKVTDRAYQEKVEQGIVQLDPWGRERSDEFSEEWNKLSDLPEEFYRIDTDGLSNKKFFELGGPSSEKQYIDQWAEHIRQYYAVQLNFDYRTVNKDDFSTSLIERYPDRGTYYAFEARKVIDDYVEWAKVNEVVSKGYADPENSMVRFENGFVIMRVYFKFMILSATDPSQTFLDNYDVTPYSESVKLELGKWYGGYSDVRLYANSATFHHLFYKIASGENMFRKGKYSYSFLGE